MTDHELEGRTAHECFELARIALDQAEQVVNNATSTLDCAKAQASAAIGIGWARLGDAMANEPLVMRAGEVMVQYPNRPGDGTHECTASTIEGPCMDCGVQYWGSAPPTVTPPRLDEKHTHDRMCYHTWVAPMEPCAKGCGTRPERRSTGDILPGYCSATCPDVNA